MSESKQPSTIGDRLRRWIDRSGLPTSTQLEELAGDASDRRFVRILPPAGPTRVLVVHQDSIDPEQLPLIQVSALFRQLPVPVPAIHDVDAELGIIVLEDLGDTTLESALTVSTPEQRDAYYDEAVELITTIQSGGRRLATTPNQAFALALDVAKLSSELDFFVSHFLEDHRRCALSAKLRKHLDDDFRTLATEMSREQRVLCHRDFHSRNLMLHEGRLHVIDLQDARMGPDTYDLVSLLRDSYVELEHRTIERLIERYSYLTQVADGVALRRRFARTALQRNLKALGTFGYQIAVKGRSRYRDAIPRTLKHLQQTLRSDDSYARLHDTLSSLIPELAAS